MMEKLLDGWTLGQVVVQQRAMALGRSMRARIEKVGRDERGQTSTEYLMIAGLMAAVIVIAFITFYWDQVKVSASKWAGTVSSAITGKGANLPSGGITP